MKSPLEHLLMWLLLAWTMGVQAAAAYQHDQQVLLPPPSIPRPDNTLGSSPLSRKLDFSLRHVYHAGSHKYPGMMRKVDVGPDTAFTHDTESSDEPSPYDTYSISSQAMQIERMVDRSAATVDSILYAGRMTGKAAYLPPEAWTVDEIAGPNVTDKQSILSLAQIANNAYTLVPNTGDWQDIKGAFNYTEDFGWEEDGLRGHIFADTTNSTIIIGLKGTSMAIFDGAETTGHDKDNDNLFASCCCGQGGQYFWKKVCDCMTSQYTCNNTCLTKSLREKSHYYHAAKDLYQNVTERYPGSEVWMTGHSLGGVVTALLGLTYGLPVVTFEAYPDALAASRLGLPTPPGYHIGRHQERKSSGIHHFGHTADPVFMGTCNAASSACTIAGYAMQSQCHTGSICVYDTVGDLGWRSGVGTHRITEVIKDVIKKYDDVPSCTNDADCVDCYAWKFFESNGTGTTTSSSAPSKPTSTKSSTRTETCKTPGWWGCLDETTSSKTTQTSTVTTTTCLTPGWFGCKDLATTTMTTTITTSAPVQAPTVTTVPRTTRTTRTTSTSSTSTCLTPGWFGCKDASPSPTPTSSASKTTQPPSSTTCTSKEWFGLICVDPSPDVTSSASHDL